MLKGISTTKIDIAYWKGYRTSDEDARGAVAQAQLEANQKEVEAMVQEIFKGIEAYMQNMGGRDSEPMMWITISERDWQAFRQDILKKVRGEK